MAAKRARGNVRTPFKRRRFRPKLSRRQKAVNRAHAKIWARGERAIATLKTWKILAQLCCCPRRATAIVQAVLVLHHVEPTAMQDEKVHSAHGRARPKSSVSLVRKRPASRFTA